MHETGESPFGKMELKLLSVSGVGGGREEREGRVAC